MTTPLDNLLACPFCGRVPERQCSDVWHVTHRRECWCAPKKQRIVGAYSASCWQTREKENANICQTPLDTRKL